jgi:Tol biopolymer transport system component
MKLWMAIAMLMAVEAGAQPMVVSMQKLPLDQQQKWSAPRFAPDGKTIFYTNASNDGVWEYAVATKKVRQITSDRGSGYGFTLSADGKQIAYRRTSSPLNARKRSQDIVLLDRSTNASRTLGTGADMTPPVFRGNEVLFGRESVTIQTAPEPIADVVEVLGIENTKILLFRNGRNELFDPLGDGSYVWPALSPDKKLLVAYDMSRGTIVSDLQGNVRTKLGRRDHPAWTRDGRWIVYMDDKDDGNNIVSSDLYCISPDGKQVVQLTDTKSVIEMYPQCSPTEDKIVFSTLDGAIQLLEYREGGR